jgi:branched-chain amino acid transport system permease protein
VNVPAFRVFGSDYPLYRVIMGGISIAMFAAIYALLARTRIGLVVRSALYRPKMAQALGHNVPAVFTGVFGVGAGLAGLAGAVAGAFYTTNPNMALELGVVVFVVVVVGGLGSLEGAMIASILIGLVSSFAVGIDASLADLFAVFGARPWAEQVGGLLTVKVSSIAATLPFALMLLVLLIRPSGLRGEEA